MRVDGDAASNPGLHMPSIVGVHIGSYKNLVNLWLPWERRMVLLGANGVGKTNLLECCALLMGTSRTQEQVQRRIPIGMEYDISVVLYGAAWTPSPDWMADLGLEQGDSWADKLVGAAQELGAQKKLLSVISRACSQNMIRYRLDKRDVAARPGGRATIVTDRVTLRLPQHVRNVPTPLSPLTHKEQRPERFGPGLSDVIWLADDAYAPVDLQWLPFSRTEPEVVRDFNDSVLDAAWELGIRWRPSARSGAWTLFKLISDIGGWDREDDAMAGLLQIAEKQAREELSATVPTVSDVRLRWNELPFSEVEASLYEFDVHSSAVTVEFSQSGHLEPLGEQSLSPLPSPSALELMSAGERRWFDEALYAAAVAITSRHSVIGLVASAVRDGLEGLKVGFWDRVAELVEVGKTQEAGLVDDLALLLMLLGDDGQKDPLYIDWMAATLEKLRNLVKSSQDKTDPAAANLAAWMTTLEKHGSGLGPAELERIRGALVAVDEMLSYQKLPRVSVRVSDEPEAHLHSGAVGAVANGLARLASESDVLIASHHARFLFQPEWAAYHLHHGPSGVLLSEYEPTLRDRREQVAASLGLSPGEGLAGIRATLLVEGKHDYLVLMQPPFLQLLRESGVLVFPIRGIKQLESAEVIVEFLRTLVSPTVGILYDNASGDTYESGAVRTFIEAASNRGLQVTPIGLTRPDIICYLNPRSVGLESWQLIVDEFNSEKATDFKGWLRDRHQVNLTSRHPIEAALDTMAREGMHFEGELVRVVKEFAASYSGTLQFDPPFEDAADQDGA